MVDRLPGEERTKQAGWKASDNKENNVVSIADVRSLLPKEVVDKLDEDEAKKNSREEAEREANRAHFPGDGREPGLPKEVKYAILGKKIEQAIQALEEETGADITFEQLADIAANMMLEPEADGEAVDALDKTAKELRGISSGFDQFLRGKVEVGVIKNVVLKGVTRKFGLRDAVERIVDAKTGNEKIVIRRNASLESNTDLPAKGTAIVKPLGYNGPKEGRRSGAQPRV